MSGLDYSEHLACARRAALAGGEVVSRYFGNLEAVREKSPGDWVSEADLASEQVIRELLTRESGLPVYGEEAGGEEFDTGWLVDPLDGTSNFVHGFDAVGVSIGLIADGVPVVGVVHAPLLQRTFYAAEGLGAFRDERPLRVSTRPRVQAIVATGFPFRHKELLPRYEQAFHAALHGFEDLRRAGAASLDLCWTAEGVFDGYFELHLGPWDVAAGAIIVREAGGIVTDWAGYHRAWLRPDVVAGVVLAAILVPQGMAYAELAGLPPVTGLYTTIACLVAYAIFGPSKVLVLGPDSSVSPLILAAIVPLVVTSDPASAITLAGMLAILVGLIEVGLGVARLGFVADLLSSEIRVGYLNGLAVTIIVGQLPKLFGFSIDANGFVNEVKASFQGLDGRNTATLVTGVAVLAVLLVLPRITGRIPAVLVAVVGATVASAVFDLAAHGVATVGVLPQGVPTPALPFTNWQDVGALLVGAIGITMVSLTDTIATSSSFAARHGDEVKPDQEMVGVGLANVAAGLFQGFAVSVSGSRTAVADQAGAKTQATGLVGAGLVTLLLLAFSGLLADLPQAALAAVVISAALSLMDLGVLRRYATIRPSALVISLVASGGVIFFGVLQGIVMAIVLAVLLFFRRSW